MKLIDAVGNFLGPLMAEYAQLIEYNDPETKVVLRIGTYEHELTLGVIQQLDAAHAEAFDRNSRAACARRDRKVTRSLL
jgi:hypothetical protein